MPKCSGCGADNHEDARFCYSCGTPIGTKAHEGPVGAPPPPPPPPSFWRKGQRFDVVGLFGFAVFLIVAGTVLAANPRLVDDLREWSDGVAQAGIWVRPPEGVIGSAALFFGVMGITGFFLAALRLVIDRSRWRAFGQALSSVGTLAFAFLVSLYASRMISGPAALAIEAAVVGVLLIAWITVGLYWNLGRWQAAANEWVRSSRRQL